MGDPLVISSLAARWLSRLTSQESRANETNVKEVRLEGATEGKSGEGSRKKTCMATTLLA